MKIKHVFLTAILLTISSLHTNAATISVTNTNDSGAGSLRQAMADAAPGDTINFSVTGTITLTSHWLVIDKNLTIQGPGASQLSISGNNALPVFVMYSGISTTLDGITIRDGRSQIGGGIYNGGTLTLKNSTVTGNFADSSGGSVDAWGGGISNSGTLIVTNSTISGNIADHGGGGIANNGPLTVNSSTISGNTANSYGGGGIYNSRTLTVTNSTISGNTGGGISTYSNGALRNTIAAGNYGGDIDGTIQTASHNLIGDAASSGGITNGVNGNIVGVNPLLGPLQDNGGTTFTHALQLGSPAINAGDNCVLTANGCGNGNPALPSDQRGMPRNGTVDIGAFEYAAATTITVTNTNDSGAGGLRQAIADAAPGDTIIFDSTVFATPQTITLTSGELVIDKDLTIQGPGQSLLSISGNNASRVFFINSGVTATLDGMTIRDGRISDFGGGGGIFNEGTLTVSNSTISWNGTYEYGGGIGNGGTLTVNNSTISGNSSKEGGGFYNAGTLIVSNCTVSRNHAFHNIDEKGNRYGGHGGGIFNDPGTVTISNTTISGNSADYGGGILIGSFGTLTVANSTISGNSTVFNGGGIHSGSSLSNETLRNTVIAGNTGTTADILGTIETASHNLIGDAASSGGIVNGVNGNIVGVNPLLGPLRNNGGSTRTHALLNDSPAINTGNNCVLTTNGCGDENPALPTDQRGMPRHGSVDIGAFERQSNEPSSTAPFDFDGDGRSDVSLFRPSDSVWYIDRSSAGFTSTQFGISTDKITPADYDGDGKTDISIFRDGAWWRINSGNSTVATVQFGIAGDIPVPGDYNGDGRDELAVYRNGEWWLEGTGRTNFGIATDKPVPADYDGDGKTDISVYRDGVWWRINSTDSTVSVEHFGIATDRPVVGDYDGDSKADLAVYRDGTWHVLQSTGGYTAFSWGLSTDTPAPADYDGDGKADAAVFRNGTWYLLNSTGGISIQQFGLPGDKPIASAYLQSE